jgi:hypothetical protein
VASYRARLVGVFDARTGQAIEGAEVRDLKSNLSALTSTTGTVRLTFLPEGGGLVRIRKIGYAPLAEFILISAADTVPVTLVLTPTPTLLPAVETRDSARHYSDPNLRAFEERRKEGYGHFFTEDELRKYDNHDMPDLIGHLPGVKITCTNRSPRRCIASLNHSSGATCRSLVVYVDGMRVPDGNLMLLRIADYAGIEEYDGAATLPPQFAVTGNGCGTLLLWSRER